MSAVAAEGLVVAQGVTTAVGGRRRACDSKRVGTTICAHVKLLRAVSVTVVTNVS